MDADDGWMDGWVCMVQESGVGGLCGIETCRGYKNEKKKRKQQKWTTKNKVATVMDATKGAGEDAWAADGRQKKEGIRPDFFLF